MKIPRRKLCQKYFRIEKEVLERIKTEKEEINFGEGMENDTSKDSNTKESKNTKDEKEGKKVIKNKKVSKVESRKRLSTSE